MLFQCMIAFLGSAKKKPSQGMTNGTARTARTIKML